MIQRLKPQAGIVIGACAVLAAAALAIDVALPLGIGTGILYVPVILLGFWLPQRRMLFALAAVATGLAIGAYFFKPSDAVVAGWAPVANRVLAVVTIWIVALFAYWHGKANAALERGEASLRKAQALARLGSYEVDLGDDGASTWSEEIFRILGLDPAQGALSPEAYRERVVDPDDRERVQQAFAQAAREGIPFALEYRVRRPDGSIRHVQSIGEPVRDRRGRVAKLAGSLLDITERKQAEAALREREATLSSVIATAPDAIITIDERGIVQSFSLTAETLFGFDADEVIGRNVRMLMPSPDREQHDGYIGRYLSTGEKRIVGVGRQVNAQRKDGTVVPIELAVGEVVLPDRRIFTGFVRDLTSRRKLEQELRQAQKMEAVGQLTGGIAHDFNNLLTSIIGNLEMLDARVEQEAQREMVREALDAAQLGAQLTDRLLSFGRRQPLRPSRIDLGELVLGMRDLLRRTLGEMVQVSSVVSGNDLTVVADPGQIENALLNLAINARDAMPQGGKLIVEAARAELDPDYAAVHADVRPGRYVLLSVTDTGTGMSPEVKDHAFEPFFTTKEAGVGSGLGLSMVYGFVKQSNGHVQLYSELGQGTTVRLYLPYVESRAEAEAEPAPAAEEPRGQGETILVVEDDARVRRVTVQRLTALGYRVIEAGAARSALELLGGLPDHGLLFTDIIMPGGMAGHDLAREARRRRPRLRVLLTTGYAGPLGAAGSLDGQDIEWLRKPYTRMQLARKVRELLDGQAEPRSGI